MAKATKETIRKLTELSRIGCPEEEQEELLTDLNTIMSYIELLQDLNTDDVPPCNHVIEGMMNVCREDEVKGILPRDTFLENSPSHIGGMIRVPEIIKKKR